MRIGKEVGLCRKLQQKKLSAKVKIIHAVVHAYNVNTIHYAIFY